jgi:D-amino peptidase
MNVLISVDMEGISGVVTSDHTTSSHKEYERFRKLMTAETNAAIEGALAGGADQIVVNDSHSRMANILIEELNPAAELISGSPKPFGMMQGIGPEVDVVFLVGYHAASGTDAAVLEHTWSNCVSIAGLWVKRGSMQRSRVPMTRQSSWSQATGP